MFAIIPVSPNSCLVVFTGNYSGKWSEVLKFVLHFSFLFFFFCFLMYPREEIVKNNVPIH